MLILSQLTSFKLNLQIANYMGYLPYQLVSESNQFHLKIPENAAQLNWKRRLGTHLQTLQLVILLSQLIITGSGPGNNLPVLDRLLGALVSVINLGLNHYLWISLSHTKEIATGINLVLKAAQEQNDKQSVSKMSMVFKLNTWIATGCWLSAAFLFPLLLIGIHLGSPCKPSLAGYWLIPECSATVNRWNSWKLVGNWSVKAPIFGWNIRVSLIGGTVTAFLLGNLQVVFSLIFQNCNSSIQF